MELRQLATFRAVAEARSFTAAADALGYAQSSVTVQMLALAEEARHALGHEDEPGGALTISAPETIVSYLLPTLMRTYRQRYPRVMFRFRPVPVADLRRSVADGTVDVAF